MEQQTETQTTTTEAATQTHAVCHDRGEVGTATASLTIKQKWHATCFRRVDADSEKNQKKRIYARLEDTPSLKQFARQLFKSKDPVAEEWLGNKHGAKDAKRTDANIAMAQTCAAASRATKRKSSKGGK